MPATYIRLGRDEHEALLADALAELRPPREHARYLIRKMLRDRGRLPGNESVSGNQQATSEEEADHASANA